MLQRGIILAVIFVFQWSPAAADDTPWRVGVARINITPELPIWLSGYGGRNKPAANKLDDLWAKALVLEDAAGNRAVLVTFDLVGISRKLSSEVCRQLDEQFKIPRANIALCASHTHSGPIVRDNLMAMFNLDEEQADRVKRYNEGLAHKLVTVVGDALNTMAPANLFWGMGKATFAVNRRNNPEGKVPELIKDDKLVGPVDHDVPVLAIRDAEGKPRAIVCGYACHATVLSGYDVSADWPGVTQTELESRHPGTIAMYWLGCGGDQNPLPRRSVALMKRHGKALADAVDATLDTKLTPIPAKLQTAYKEIDIAFAPLPTRAELEVDAAGQPPRSRWAKYLLAAWDRDGSLPSKYPYPIQLWRLGPDVTWLFLGGEVVVDYSLRFKSEAEPKKLWVASYANDVMGYIPSRRVLSEGGYEGSEARIPYGLPAVWAPEVEQQIVDTVHQMIGRP